MVLLAAALARVYFGAAVPDAITSAERDDPKIEPMVQRVMARPKNSIYLRPEHKVAAE